MGWAAKSGAEFDVRMDALERVSYGDPGALGAVDAANNEHACRMRNADTDRDDRPAALRAAERKRTGDDDPSCEGESRGTR